MRKKIANEIDRRVKKLEETIMAIEPIDNNKIFKIADALNNAFKEIGNISIRLMNIEKERKQSNCEIGKEYSITAILDNIEDSELFVLAPKKRIDELKSKNDEIKRELKSCKEKLRALNELLKEE